MPRALPLALILTLTAMGAPVAAASAAETAEAGPPTTFRDEYLVELDWAAERLKGLAGAFPAERYDWRPAEGIRSVAEAFQHASSSIYYLTERLDVPLPEGLPDDVRELETRTAKGEVVAELERALAHVRGVVKGMTAEELDGEVELFGRATTARGVLLRILVHVNEHTGQLVAYARSTGVTPPWSGSE